MDNSLTDFQKRILDTLSDLGGQSVPSPRTYTTEEAARYLKLHPETLKKRCRAGLIRHLPNFKRPLRFSREELDRYLAGEPLSRRLRG